MAQTTTRSSRSTRSGSKRASPNGSRATNSRSGARGSTATRKRSTQKSTSSRGGPSRRRTGSSRRRGSSGGNNTRERIAGIADKAKTPAIAGGAALAGVAAGAVVARRGKSSGLMSKLPKPRMPGSNPSTAKALGSAASEIAKTGYKVGQLSSEVRRVREAVADSDK
jgi:hypothetical protein